MLYAQQEKIINWQQEWEEPRSLSPLRLWHSKLHNHEWLSSSCENRIIVTLVKNNFCSSKAKQKWNLFHLRLKSSEEREKWRCHERWNAILKRELLCTTLPPFVIDDFFKSTIKCIQDDCKGVKLFLKVFRRVENLKVWATSRMSHIFKEDYRFAICSEVRLW